MASSYIENLRNSQRQSNDDAQAIQNFNDGVSRYANGYISWAKNNNGKFKSSTVADIEARLRNLVKQAGISDGKLTNNSTEAEIAAYGNDFISQLSGEQNFGVVDYIRKYGTKEQQEAYNKAESAAKKEAEIKKDPVKAGFRNAALIVGSLNPIGATAIGLGALAGAADKKKTNEALSKADEDYNKWISDTNKSAYDIFENYEAYAANAPRGNATATTAANTSVPETSEDTVTFTLPRANDPNYRGFGQKIVDLGLATSKGLWGADGDVQFYTKQLYDQGALDSRGNLKIGVPIKLKKRKVSN